MEISLLGALCSDSIQVFGTEDFCAINHNINTQEKFYTGILKKSQYIYTLWTNISWWTHWMLELNVILEWISTFCVLV